MVRISGRTITLNNENESTSQPPLGIGVFYNQDPGNIYPAVGYMMPSYSRAVSVDGVRNETLFWDFCTKCPLYQRRECAGGYRVLTTEPRVDHVRLQNSMGRTQVRYYNKEFCKMYYGTDELHIAVNSPGSLIANLYPHFMMIKDAVLYWYVYRINPETQQLEYLPYQLFNTHGSGEICYGGSASNYYSLPQRYETFFNARANTDLMPVSMPLADWIRSFTPEALIEQTSWCEWLTHDRQFRSTDFEILPPNYDSCKFLEVSTSNIPPNFDVIRNYSVTQLPFLRGPEGKWVCSKDINFEITAESWPEVYNYLNQS